METYHHERQQRTFKIEPINRYHRVMEDFPEVAWVQPTDEFDVRILKKHELFGIGEDCFQTGGTGYEWS